MHRDLILGTAGHIDHGKTSLVKALTGIDCDRLPDEKRRGITIDIGFAALDLDHFHIGIVDCPGHERFVRNMLAGSTGIDLAMLVIAADDSVKPQTREHLDILRLLGLRHGLTALTKVDLVNQERREFAEMEIRDLLQGTFLKDAAIIPVSVRTGEGIEELKQEITRICALIESRDEGSCFRLAIDRSFTVAGHGTVVTGSVISGRVKVGDALDWLPQGVQVRVRGLQQQDHAVESVHRGQRAAINLAGVGHAEIVRGQELASPGYLIPSRILTVRLQNLASPHRLLPHRLPLRLHLGTAEIMASLSLLDCDSLSPGQWGLGQLFLEEPTTAVWGQPFVLRDSSAEHTLGGGQVLQPLAGKIRRRHIESLERIEQLASNDVELRGLAFAWLAGMHGFEPFDLVRGIGVSTEEAARLVADWVKDAKAIELQSAKRTWLLHADRLREAEEKVVEELGRLHGENPLLTNHDRAAVVANLEYLGPEPQVQSLLERLIARKKLVGDSRRIARADFKPKLSVNQRKLKDKIVEDHKAAGFNPPEPKSFAPQAGGNATNLRDVFEVACAEGLLFRITEEIYLHADWEASMRKRLQDRFAADPRGLTVAEIRDLLDTTRKFAVPLCEYLDRIGTTRRAGDLRIRG